MSFNAIGENKILANISEFTVIGLENGFLVFFLLVAYDKFNCNCILAVCEYQYSVSC